MTVTGRQVYRDGPSRTGRAVWDRLLHAARAVHERPDLARFADFPTRIIEQDVTPHRIAPAALLEDDRNLRGGAFGDLRDAIVAGAGHAHWRETYKGTDIGEYFLSKFGCYEVIGGPDAPFAAPGFRSFIVYMPPGLHYPWHHHPAEELYFVVAGEAEFHLGGADPQILGSGQSMFHAGNRPHALTTHDQPVLCYVLWRGSIGTPPVLTEEWA